MGAPFDAKRDEMTTAPLMVTVRNSSGTEDARHRRRRVAGSRSCSEAAAGGRELPSTGDREQ